MDSQNNTKNHIGSVHQGTYTFVAYIYDVWVWFLLFPIGGWTLWRRKFVEFIDPQPGERIVELCCGTGAVTVDLAQQGIDSHISASDISPDQIRVAKWKARKKRINIDYSVQNASSTSYPSCSCDKVVISAALHEMNRSSRKRIFQEISRLLKPGGCFYVTEPEPSQNWWVNTWLFRIVFNAWHPETKAVVAFINSKIERELEETGFNVDKKIQEKAWYFQCVKCSKIEG